MDGPILVTGGCGFTGSNMIEYLAEIHPETRLIATDLPGSDRGEYYAEVPDSTDPQPVYYAEILEEYDVEFFPADLTDREDVRRLCADEDYETVFHIASLFDYFASREVLYEVNVDGTRNLLLELAEQEDSPRLVHWSTLGVLGDAGFDRPKTEEDSYHPENRYCESKMVEEEIVKAFQDRLDATIVRPAPIYGPRHHYGLFTLLAVIDTFDGGPVFRNYPRKYQRWFPCVHVADVVRASEYLASRPEAVGETYNLLSDPIRTDELSQFLSAELGRASVTFPLPEPLYRLGTWGFHKIVLYLEQRARQQGERPLIEAQTIRYLSSNMWFSNQKLKEAGYEFQYEDPRKGLREYVQWCRKQGYVDVPDETPSVIRSLGSLSLRKLADLLR